MASIDLRESFLSNLELRGVPSTVWETYERALVELAAFLQTSPTEWTQQDLERFLKLRAPLLDRSELAHYGAALALVSELVASHDGRQLHIELEDALETGDVALANETGESDYLSAAIDRIVARPPSPTASPSARDSTPSDRTEATSGDMTDFLAENVDNWRQRTGRRAPITRPGSEFVQGPVRPRTSPGHPAGRLEAGLDNGASRAAKDPGQLRVRWARQGWGEVEWTGFVAGNELRRTLDKMISAVVKRGGSGCLIDMQDASVLGQGDADWFVDWLARCGTAGVERVAFVSPDHIISRMQLNRLQQQADVSSMSFPVDARAEIAFFDILAEARRWLLPSD